MGIFDVFTKQFIDVIQWTEDDSGTLAWRFPVADQEIQSGAALTVRDTQTALFVNEGKLADVFNPGLYKLNTSVLPILTTLNNWDKAFEAPFKSDVYFFSTREQLDQRWGTTNPITIRDKDFGQIRLRAHGTYTWKIEDPKVFYEKVSGATEIYNIDQIDDQLRSMILTNMSSYMGQDDTSFIDMAANQNKFSENLKAALEEPFLQYGLSLKNFFVQNLSLPEELQAYLDKQTSMNMLGDLKRYAQFESADNIGTAAANEGGAAGMGVGLGAGMSMGQTMMNAMGNGNSGSGGAGSSEEDPMEKIEKLHALKEKGILSEEEFNQKKAELLKKI
ncbi:MAG: hypothetical protein HOM21_13950 [Halobacteriovoraceae bacterium]|jgi:membrane protease subunit (stomatin/prohibitin family)|nr:hypothetical protein [Halobacteriovoraceae bacterium]